MRIKNDTQNTAALAKVAELFDARFDSETPRAKKLLKLVDAICRFEEYHYPIGERSKLQSFIAWLKWMFG
jgi:hypothetical protein